MHGDLYNYRVKRELGNQTKYDVFDFNAPLNGPKRFLPATTDTISLSFIYDAVFLNIFFSLKRHICNFEARTSSQGPVRLDNRR